MKRASVRCGTTLSNLAICVIRILKKEQEDSKSIWRDRTKNFPNLKNPSSYLFKQCIYFPTKNSGTSGWYHNLFSFSLCHEKTRLSFEGKTTFPFNNTP